MKFKGANIIHRGIRKILSLCRKRAVILLYHRIAQLRPDPQLLCVTPSNFAEHLEHLQNYYQLISLQTLSQSLLNGDIPDKAVVITFDDGYADNLFNAEPVLEHYNTAATIFVSSSYIGSNRESCSDELERYLLIPESLPSSLTLTINGKSYYGQIDNCTKNIGEWNVSVTSEPSLRNQCYRQLHALLRPLDNLKRQNILNALARWASCPTDARVEHRTLSADELETLANNKLVEIGSHGATHLVLGVQPSEVQHKEINESKQQLESILNRPVTSFSYPYGGPNDVNSHTVDLVKKAGFKLACANIAGVVTSDCDPFWLPRFLVRNWNGREFANRLKKIFNS